MLPDLTQYMWIVWLVLALVFVIVELLTLEFTFLMLASGTLIGGLGVNLLGGAWWLQVLAAAAISALHLFTIRPLLLRALHRSSVLHPTNVDAIRGRGPGSDALTVGDRIVVTAVRGAMVEVALAAASESALPTDRSSD